ncbi:MAG: precorrin-4 C(11)-methyltransferase, partial [Duncaniella sp.]|nr:precorrin-4 C(11)-methyltransferase [Duncaniella sp.]
MKTLILNVTAAGGSIASAIAAELAHSDVVMLKEWNRILPEGCTEVVFVGALGICVRALGHLVKDKYTDPAVVCVDSTGKYAISVLSGHVGGANELTRRVAAIVGATPVITT